MKLFDTHFHFYEQDGPPEEYWRRIRIPELAYVMAAGGDFAESRIARGFAAAVDGAWFACGVHPHSADKYLDGIGAFEEFRGVDKLAAIGEIGLDYFYENSDRRAQWTVMEKFLALALEWQLPAIVHCRDLDERDDAYQDAYRMMRDFSSAGGRGVIHCFAGTPAWAERFLELGYYLGITGMVTFPKAVNIRALVPVIPDDRLVIETDSPYLAPVPHRGKPNHPGYLIKVAEKLAELKQMTVDELAALTTANGGALFGVEVSS